MSFLKEIVDFTYNYGTDFIINLANTLNLSYYEVNLLLFGIIYPFTLLVLVFIIFYQRRIIKNILRRNKNA